MKDITTEMFREETIGTSTHKFRNPEDVVTPFLYSGVIRAVDPVTRIHPKYHVEVTIEPEYEMSKFVLLSLHGIPKPPKKEQVCGSTLGVKQPCNLRATLSADIQLDPSTECAHLHQQQAATERVSCCCCFSFAYRLCFAARGETS